MISANVLGAASAVWCGLVVALCTGSGFAIGRLPPWVQAALPWAVLGGTGALILANLAAVLARWLRPGDRAAALPSMALVQVLFGVLFIGVHGVLGPGHFRHPSAPGPEDWAAFAAAHAVRGADALDILEDYPLGIEAIRPNSDLVRSLLVAFNLVNGLVVLELIGRLVRQVRLALVGHLPHQFGVLIARALTKGTIVVAGLAAALLALLALFGDPGPNDAPAWVGGLVAGGLVLLMVVLYFAERFLAAWGDRKYGRMPLEVAEPHSVTGFKGNLRLLVVVVGSVWATSWSALAVCAAIVGLDYGIEQHGAEAVGRWAAVRALQAADVADVMILFSIAPYELDDFRFRTPLALFIRAVAVLTLSAVVAGLIRWWTRAPNGDDGERLRVSFRGWIGLLLGVLLGSGIVALARVSSNW